MNLFQTLGAQAQKPVRFAPIFTDRFFQGIWTQRSPLRDAGATRLEQKYYGMRGDAMIAGSNVEISNRLTPIRRPGNSLYNSQNFSNVSGFYEFRLFNSTVEQIKVMVDGTTPGGGGNIWDGTGPSTKTSVLTKASTAGQAFMQSVGNVLFIGDGAEQKKWVQSILTWSANLAVSLGNGFPNTYLIDSNGNIQQVTSCIVPVSSVQITANVLTITSTSSLVSILSVGQKVTFAGVGTAAFLNGQTVTIVTVSGSTFTAAFTHANYGPTADTGTGTLVQGGSPVTGTVQPTWNTTVPSSSNNFAGGTTDDGFTRWTNRGVPLENFGINGPFESGVTTAPTASIGSSSTGWATNTFYSADGVIIDSNGGLQMVTTAGLSGASTPAWQAAGAGVGTTTTDGTVVWTKIQTAASLNWAAHTFYNTTPAAPALGTYVVGKDSSGTNCLFKLANGRGMACTNLKAQFWIGGGFNTQVAGVIFGTNGSVPASTSGELAINSLMFNPAWFTQAAPNTQPITNAVINAAGEITSTPAPYAAATRGYLMAAYGQIYVPSAGNYGFAIKHDDGFFMGIDGGATLVSGAQVNYGQTVTLVKGYPILAGRNVTGSVNDNVTINFPQAGIYNIEVDYASSDIKGGAEQQTLSVSIGSNIVPLGSLPPISTSFESATNQPVWPAWTTTQAPQKPGVYDASTNVALNAVPLSSGWLRWINLGPVSDLSWTAKTNYHLAGGIIDSNGNNQVPFRAGISGTKTPVWATGFNQLTIDNSLDNLTWINQGGAGPSLSGTLSTFNTGWKYTIALVNTLTNTVSNAGIVSAATGNFIGTSGVTISGGLPALANIDPQADYVAIFRTTDGGPDPFLIPGTGNSIYTIPLSQYLASGYTDTTLDANLNELASAPLSGENTPPPVGLVNLSYHLNRVWGSVGNTVYWSTGPDTPIGNGNEGFAPDNFDGVPSRVTRIVPLSVGALIFTVSDIYLILGDGTSISPILPAKPYLKGIGLLHNSALDINGSIIYMNTADNQIVDFDPSAGVAQVGFPIGDQFRGLYSPSTSFVTWHVDGSEDTALYFANNSTGWFRMCPTPAPENGVTWSPFATIVGGCGAVQSVEVNPGVHRLLIGPGPATQIGNIGFKYNIPNYVPSGGGSVALDAPVSPRLFGATRGSVLFSGGGGASESTALDSNAAYATVCNTGGAGATIDVIDSDSKVFAQGNNTTSYVSWDALATNQNPLTKTWSAIAFLPGAGGNWTNNPVPQLNIIDGTKKFLVAAAHGKWFSAGSATQAAICWGIRDWSASSAFNGGNSWGTTYVEPGNNANPANTGGGHVSWLCPRNSDSTMMVLTATPNQASGPGGNYDVINGFPNRGDWWLTMNQQPTFNTNANVGTTTKVAAQADSTWPICMVYYSVDNSVIILMSDGSLKKWSVAVNPATLTSTVAAPVSGISLAKSQTVMYRATGFQQNGLVHADGTFFLWYTNGAGHNALAQINASNLSVNTLYDLDTMAWPYALVDLANVDYYAPNNELILTTATGANSTNAQSMQLALPVGTGPILKRDLTLNTDNGQTYTANFVIGSLVLAHPGQLAELGFITTDSVGVGSRPSISVLLDEALPYYGGAFESLPNYVDDPTQLPASTSIYRQRFYFSQGALPAYCRDMQLKVSWPAENFQNELLSITIFGGYLQEN